MIRAVIFDMDGVLIEARDWHYEALNRALGLFGYRISRDQHLTRFDGLPTSAKLEILSVEYGFPRELHAFINEMKQAYTMEIVHTRCKPRFVHEHALSTLKAMDYKLAVASNSIRNSVEVMIRKSGLDGYLDQMLSACDVRRPKPDPEIYLTTIARLGLTPRECVIVEDNKNGIMAARASGAHVLVVRDTEEVNLDNILRKIRSADEEFA
jgi:beta-phosphoglucomutase